MPWEHTSSVIAFTYILARESPQIYTTDYVYCEGAARKAARVRSAEVFGDCSRASKDILR